MTSKFIIHLVLKHLVFINIYKVIRYEFYLSVKNSIHYAKIL
jgi:hypothetical protein